MIHHCSLTTNHRKHSLIHKRIHTLIGIIIKQCDSTLDLIRTRTGPSKSVCDVQHVNIKACQAFEQSLYSSVFGSWETLYSGCMKIEIKSFLYGFPYKSPFSFLESLIIKYDIKGLFKCEASFGFQRLFFQRIQMAEILTTETFLRNYYIWWFTMNPPFSPIKKFMKLMHWNGIHYSNTLVNTMWNLSSISGNTVQIWETIMCPLSPISRS